jgi:hypothetical protein
MHPKRNYTILLLWGQCNCEVFAALTLSTTQWRHNQWVEVKLQTFLKSAVDRDEWPVSRSGRFNIRQRDRCTHYGSSHSTEDNNNSLCCESNSSLPSRTQSLCSLGCCSTEYYPTMLLNCLTKPPIFSATPKISLIWQTSKHFIASQLCCSLTSSQPHKNFAFSSREPSHRARSEE